MTGTLLIDAGVRQTTVLLATLATATGNRASLAHVANEATSSGTAPCCAPKCCADSTATART